MKTKLVIALMVCALLMNGCGSIKKENATDTSSTKDVSANSNYVKAEETSSEETSSGEKVDGVVTITTDDNNNVYTIRVGESKEDVTITYDHKLLEARYENRFFKVSEDPLSTFSIDVDTAAYSNIRRMILDGYEPDRDSVRIEEMINYFDYDYTEPKGNAKFSVNTEIGICPWNPDNKLALIGIKGKENTLPVKSNLVFLLDVSGSMNRPEKLPLLKTAFKMLLDSLGEKDRISVVVYAGSSGVVIDGARGDEKDYIKRKLNELEAGGSTAGAGGINLAYKLAEKYFIEGGNNRVILATDGDFNVGPSSDYELERLIEAKRETGVFLSVLGFGTDNFQDNKMEILADKGNGNFYYLDTIHEAKKVLVDNLSGMLFTIAKDVKIQVEFNPDNVAEYKLIGYENRLLNKEDFNDDKIDAGDLGAGHTVTALYELVPKSSHTLGQVDGLKYQEDTRVDQAYKDEWMTVKLRYKNPDSDKSIKVEKTIRTKDFSVFPSNNFEFASAVAEFGMILRKDIDSSDDTIKSLLNRAERGLGGDGYGYRMEFVNLVEIFKTF